jgi:NADH-quinone oxidoreductase subunit F/NAD(P)H dehydrogenase (quinone)/NADP-reducing hydrogenase subunit HndC
MAAGRSVGVCTCLQCQQKGGGSIREAFEKEIIAHGLAGKVDVAAWDCGGLCGLGPVAGVPQEGVVYCNLKPEDAAKIVKEHLAGGTPVERLRYKGPGAADSIPMEAEHPFFKNQVFLVMRNKGLIDPEKIDEYIARDGYFGLAKALREMTPEKIIEEMLTSGLRGRGGAGFPTGMKWKFAAGSKSDVKYVLCNADEGDPGAFMDRSVLEADPHAVIEGMIIAARAIGAHQGYIYCRTEYPLAIHRLDVALAAAREYGLLGKDILGTGFDFDLEIYEGAGAFVCGEETALMASIEGRRGMPRPRPPFPAHQGLWKKPTILNNVETFANVPQIILNGGAWYAGVGTEKSKGTKVFALSGAIKNIGLVEVPNGTTLRTIVYDIGGGVPNKRKFKAVQLGGPSGGCVPDSHLDTIVDYEEIAKVGAIMGSGGMIVMDETTCMVDMARYFMDFIQDESCGKCTPCREGTHRMLEILQAICEGRGEADSIAKLEELSEVIRESSLCGLGQTGPNPVLSTLRYFRDEYEAHIVQKKCPAKRCVKLLKFAVNQKVCSKCGLCFKACTSGAISWQKKSPAEIDRAKCVQCMACYAACRFGAID